MILRKSITAKFVSAVFLLLFVGQCAGMVMYIMTERSALRESLQRRMDRAAGFLAGVGGNALQSYDYSTIDLLLEEAVRDEDITSIHIADETGKILREKIKADDAGSGGLNPFRFSDSFMAKAPVVAGDRNAGIITVHFVAESVNSALARSVVVVALSQFVLLAAVGFLLMFLFRKHIKKPVSSITGYVQKLTYGDLTVAPPRLGEDEVGRIAQGMAFLAEKLSSTVQKINSTAGSVSMAVKQVEFTYRSVSEGITKQTQSVKEVLAEFHRSSKSQAEISEGTGRLQSISSENVSSLLEMKMSSEEIASQTVRLFRASEAAYSVATQMSQSGRLVGESVDKASSGLDDTSSSVEEIEASIKEVAEHARESSQLAELVKETTSAGGMMSVVNAVEGMESISEHVNKSAVIIQQLGLRSADIEKVLSVIKEVTEQTNLLSLNAAILAAQAGEYGKSFSVVADEIRALSERTASSTREIGGIVKTIQRDIRDAVQSTNMTKEKVDEGNGLVVKVGEALREILNASVRSADMTKAIERATEEQSLGLRQITAAIDGIRRTMSDVVKSTKEQKTALGHLLEGIGEVKEVAELNKRGASEQAEGVRLISRNLEMANDRVSQIHQLNHAQKKMNGDMVILVEQIDHIASATARDVQEVTASLLALAREIEALKQEMEAFKTE